jgi:hypothetical protein
MADTQVQAPLSSVTPEQAASEPGFQTGTKAKPTITNQAVLSELENIYKQRKAEKEYFLNPLKQAAVGWWNPQGPGVGLPLADRMRREQDSELQDLQSKIITGKIGIGQLQGAMGSLQSPETTAPRTSVAGAPQAGGATAPAPTGVAAITPNAQGGYSYRGVPLDADAFNVIRGFLAKNDLAGADEYLKSVVTERTKFLNNPAAYEQKERWNPDKGRKEYKMPIETRAEYLSGATPTAPAAAPAPMPAPTTAPVAAQPTSATGVNAYNVGNVRPQGASEGFQQPKDFAEGLQILDKNLQAYGQKGVNTLEAIINRWAPPKDETGKTINDTDSYIKSASQRLSLDPKQPVDLSNPAVRQAIGTAIMLHEKGPKAIFSQPTTSTAPVSIPQAKVELAASNAPTAPRRFNSKSEQEAYEKQQAEFLTQASSKAGSKVGERQAFFESAATDASKDLQTSNVLLNILDKNPAGIGFAYKNKALGTAIEGVKLLTGKDIQPLARMATLSKEDMDAVLKFDALAQQNNLKFRQAVMKGTGQVSDFETKLVERASGLDRDTSIESNRFFATVAAENFRMFDKLGTEWQNYQKRNPGVTFDKFEQSPEFKSALKERETRLTSYFPELSTGETAFGSSKPKSNASSKEIEGWKQRYGKPQQ